MDFLENISQKTSLIIVLQSSNQIKNKIFRFLQIDDIINLTLTCKSIQLLHKFKKQNDDIQTWKNNLLKFSKKKKDYKIIETQYNIIVKLRYFTVPHKYLDKKNWKMIDSTDQILSQKLKEDKFLKQTENVFFKNVQTDEIMFMNRSLIDQKLNYGYWKEDNNEENKYDIIYEEDANHYDFSNMQSMLQRQKDIMQKFQDREYKKEQDALPENCLDQLIQLKKITMILCCGGYFSMAVFVNGKCTLHHSDHKYVCRKKAGQRQISRDKSTGCQGSIGSQIRRDQENHHQENVKQILTDNFAELESSDVVFLQAPGMNKLFLVQDVEPLGKVKQKLRSLCISSKKAKYTEIERIYKAISKVYLIFDKKK